jgi:predicted metal-dependent hydrolase
MSESRARAVLYMKSKVIWTRKENMAETDPDGYLFANGTHRTKILPEDLPEWYVYGYMYKRQGYMSARGVKHLLYVPNYTFDNHLHKYDSLFISYDELIEPYEFDNGRQWYKGYDQVLSGSVLVDFVKAAGKYSCYDIGGILSEIARKKEFFYERNPEQARADYKSNLSEYFGRRLPYRGREYILGGDGGKKPFFDNCFCVPVNYSNEQVKAACIILYRSLARKDLTAKINEYAERMNVPPPVLTINGAKIALCSYTKSANFSWRLMMGCDDVIDYVVVYALAHVIEPNRTPRFWAVIENILPDYKERQRKLRSLQERLKSEDWL